MTDQDQMEEALLVHRKSRDKHLASLKKIRTQLQSMMNDEPPAELDMTQLQEILESLTVTDRRCIRDNEALIKDETDADTINSDETAWDVIQEVIRRAKGLCKKLMNIRSLVGSIQGLEVQMDNLLYQINNHPEDDYSISLKQCTDLVQLLLKDLQNTNVPRDHILWTQIKDLNRRDQELQSKKGALTPTDTKDPLRVGKSKAAYKLPKIVLPPFDGELHNWNSFWNFNQRKELSHQQTPRILSE